MTPEQEALLNMTFEELPDISRKGHEASIGKMGMDIHGDRQRYLANPDSLWEVSLAGKAVSGPAEEENFDAAMRLYDKLIKRHEAQVVVTHILNGTRSVVLRSPVVKVKERPVNPIGMDNYTWEDDK